ncbi:MAG: hypothetical protein H7316_11285 [Tardiphaga sp.]|uniref:hypothetical protein n=1 Tax=Tardiphaga sp. TaxID=1926292 RepID=UPI0019C5ED93|nr:hypothetical protein [Tardiphaga sp.]MBC7584322.1 hypothetical protein [Tardiphaga sp.]
MEIPTDAANEPAEVPRSSPAKQGLRTAMASARRPLAPERLPGWLIRGEAFGGQPRIRSAVGHEFFRESRLNAATGSKAHR